MAGAKKFRAIKGVRDILPPESALWNRVEQTARDVFGTYGFQEIRLPIFEQTELFARSVGVDTDIVSKEMYTFEDREVPIEWPEDVAELSRFLEDLERGMETNKIPRTYQNVAFVGVLKKEFVEEFRQFEDLLKTNDLHQERLLEDQLRAHQAKYLRFLPLAHNLKLGDEISLRPEATASVVRAYVEHGMHSLPGDVKLYYMGPMFRRERPQKGRYRQFYQIGAEVLGQSDHPALDAEVIEMLMAFFDRLGLVGAKLHLNSIGCQECRPKYVEKLREALLEVINELGADSQRRIETNPLRVLDSKLPDEQAIIEKLPRIGDHLCASCRDHFAQVQQQLKQRTIAYEINWRLVRGLDYYMRTTFEITAPGLGAQNAICGGGRYDGLVELLGGPPTKGIGFAIGTDRLVLSLSINLAASVSGTATVSADLTTEPVLDVFIAWMGAAAYPVAVRLVRRLRGDGLSVELPAEEWKLKKSLGLADKLGARYAVLLGEDELKSETFLLRRMADGEQKKLSESELLNYLKLERSH